MNRVLPIVCAAGVALCSGCARQAPSPETRADAGALIDADHSRHDFGVVTEGDKLKHTFVLVNGSQAPIQIANVQPNCECVTASLANRQIAPGDKAQLDVVFDTLARTGDQDKLVTVATTDPSAAAIKLRVLARVEPLLGFKQEEDEEDEDMFVGDSKTREAWIIGKRADVAHLKIERVTDPRVTAEITSKTEGDSVQQALRLTVPGDRLGHFHAGVILSTDIVNKPKLAHFFEWTVHGNVTVTPPSLHFETGGPSVVSGPDELVAQVKSRLEGFAASGPKSNSDVFQATLRPTDTRGVFELRVRVADRKKLAQTQVAEVQLSTNDKVEPVVKVPISISPALPTPPRPAPSAPPRP